MRRFFCILILAAVIVDPANGRDLENIVSFVERDGQLAINVDDRQIAAYVYRDAVIPRPYFAHVKAPGGVQVTRHHPPKDDDRGDHETMHPGIWMAFGDLEHADFWRNKARIVHSRFLEGPTAGAGRGSFVEEKLYRRTDGIVICRETFRCSVLVRPGGYLLTWDSTFRSDTEFTFGDQEEMGLGLRVATPISEINGGRLSDSENRQGAKTIWSHASEWCDYSGFVDGHRCGMTLMCHPQNFRASWMHARDYGFVAANPFGRQAMDKGERSQVTIKPGESLRLRYAVWIHSGATPAIQATFQDYLQLP